MIMSKHVLHTRGRGNLIWSTLTWSMRGTHIRLGNTMREAMMSKTVSSLNELQGDNDDVRELYNHTQLDGKMLGDH